MLALSLLLTEFGVTLAMVCTTFFEAISCFNRAYYRH